jgi:hypothetical protein
MIEIWRDIKDYEGLYQVSNLGRVKSLKRTRINKGGSTSIVKETILTPLKTDRGYLQVRLYKDGKNKLLRIARLVAEAFIPNPDNLPTVDHINRIRTDNRVENLRWATMDLQVKNRDTEGIIEKMINKPSLSKSVKQYTLDGQLVAEYPSIAEASRQTGTSHSKIVLVCQGKRKTAGGYIWQYA